TLLEGLAAACLLGIIVIILFGVVSRYAFNASLTWSDEAARHLFIYLIFLAVPSNLLRDEQLALTAVVDRLGAGARRAVDVINEAVVAFVLFMMLTNGVTLVRLISGTTAALALPNALIYAAMPLAGGLGLLIVALASVNRGFGWLRAVAPLALGFLAFL